MKTHDLARITVVTVFTLAMGLTNTSGTAAAEEQLFENYWVRVTPSVAWCDDPVTFEAHIVGRNDVAKLEILRSTRRVVESVLYDDGTHGDAAAGDNVFTASGIRLSCDDALANLPGYVYAGSAGSWFGFLRATLKDGKVLLSEGGTKNNGAIIVGLVDPGFKNAFKVKDLGNGISATKYVLFVQDISRSIIDNYQVGQTRTAPKATAKLYSVFPDAFDFVVVTLAEQNFNPDGCPAFSERVSNAVKKLGIPLFNDAAKYGSAGRLKNVVFHYFGDVHDLNHELAHTWGGRIGASLGLVAKDGSHWNPESDIDSPLTLGPHFRYNGDGTWKRIQSSLNAPYAPLDLYTMGLIPAEQVPPIHILTNPNLGNPERVTAASVKTVTIEDILRAEGGAREPGVGNSPRDFTLAFVVVGDKPYSEASYAYFSIVSRWLASREPVMHKALYGPFSWATGGRMTLNTELPVGLP